MASDWQLEGKIALVTAGGAGIGRAIALEWARRDGKVLVTDIVAADAQKVADEITEFGGTAAALRLDVTSKQEIDAAVRCIVDRFGAIDALFNVAGVNLPKNVEETDDDEWLSVIDININSVYRCSKAAIPELRKRGGGAIVNVASIAGIIGEGRCAAYTASKGGVVLLTRNMAMDFARDGIRVNAICPAGTLSPRIEGYMRQVPGLEKDLLALRPIGRFASTTEMALPALFLASPAASYVTGAALVVDGGLTAGFRVPIFDRM